MYSILKGTELEESAEEENPNERKYQPKEIPPIEYDGKMPIEFFDFIVIDECHRSIYNLWKQVLEYYDLTEIGNVTNVTIIGTVANMITPVPVNLPVSALSHSLPLPKP